MAKKIKLTEMQKYGFTNHPSVPSASWYNQIRMDRKSQEFFIKENEEYQTRLFKQAGLTKRED